MAHPLATLLIIVAIVTSTTVTGFAECSERDRQSLRDSGMSEYKIADLCGDLNQSPQESTEQLTRPRAKDFQGKLSRLSNICETPEVFCFLEQEAPPGTPCVCNSEKESYKGAIVSR